MKPVKYGVRVHQHVNVNIISRYTPGVSYILMEYLLTSHITWCQFYPGGIPTHVTYTCVYRYSRHTFGASYILVGHLLTSHVCMFIHSVDIPLLPGGISTDLKKIYLC